jgi:hypothetical protein
MDFAPESESDESRAESGAKRWQRDLAGDAVLIAPVSAQIPC